MATSYHRRSDTVVSRERSREEARPVEVPRKQELTYRFYPHFHPYVGELVKRLIEGSVRELQAADTAYKESPYIDPRDKPQPQDYELYEQIFDRDHYYPTALVAEPHPVKKLDFTSSGAYAIYNWELFYHVPITVAIHLSKNQRFEQAQQWFHYVFDPTDDSNGPTPERFWKVKPFQTTDVKSIEEVLVNLATADDPDLWKETIESINKWKETPFRPHAVAHYRPWAYMFKTVMAYLDNLIDWGDSLFRQDTGESINEATQLYVLAANILGLRPQAVPKKGSVRPQNYASLRGEWNAFSDVRVELETALPFDLGPFPDLVGHEESLSTLSSLGQALYFCVPRNDKLLGYWDTVADRLFKIHNSLNIQGVFRQLPLFEPPIDPAMLARAAAAGLDEKAIRSGANQPLPLVRFQFLVQKAAEICQEVKSLGNGLLSAIEKEDNETLALLRAKHEHVILELAETIKYGQWQEALKGLEGLERSLASAGQRYTYYERLLGKLESEITIPELDPLNDLGTMAIDADEPQLDLPDIDMNIAAGAEGIAGGKKISSYELRELELLEDARGLQAKAAKLDLLGSYLSFIPQFDIHGTPVGVGVATGFGGVQLSKMVAMIASAKRIAADQHTYKAAKAAKIGVYARREQEWALQRNLAAGEINQIFKQIRAAQIRVAIAEQEWENHTEQIHFSEEIKQFLRGEEITIGDGRHKKTSTQGFYAWMKREVRSLYGQVFKFAFDIAKKAERALQHELGDPSLNYLQFGYLDGKEGLLAGERLYLDIKRMEMAYHDLNQREYELTKHISLRQVNPIALLQLRTTGRCTFALPEALFDMDGPGHYFRRIKSVAESIPCVTGPYTSVNCTLTLLKSAIRRSSSLEDSYARSMDSDDTRFSDYYGSLQSIVTSSGQSDHGLFEANLRDERYLPFEGSGVISEWQLQLPADPSEDEPCQFDYDTISDVILHIRYTAREGGELLRRGALDNLVKKIEAAQATGSVLLLSVRHDFPNVWAQFKRVEIGSDTPEAGLTLHLQAEHYPFWSQNRLAEFKIKYLDLFAEGGGPSISVTHEGGAGTLVADTTLGNLRADRLTSEPPLPTIGEVTLNFDDNSMEDVLLALTWGIP